MSLAVAKRAPHYRAYCTLCRRDVVICGQCGRSSCLSAGRKCNRCEDAFAADMQDRPLPTHPQGIAA